MPERLHPDDRAAALILAMTVRNAMEDFHVAHLSDEQMRQLNPIIRNAIATGLHAIRRQHTSSTARAFLRFQQLLIPKYWEPPVLLSTYREAEQHPELHHVLGQKRPGS